MTGPDRLDAGPPPRPEDPEFQRLLEPPEPYGDLVDLGLILAAALGVAVLVLAMFAGLAFVEYVLRLAH